MTADQGQTTAGNQMPAGWAFGKNSVKAHYFKQGYFTSLCGKCASNNGRQRNERAPIATDCRDCTERYHDGKREQAALDD